MQDGLRLLCVMAHPDDESLGMGSTLVRYAAEGVETHLLCATHGERGWFGPEETDPGFEEMARIREREMRCSAGVLGLRSLHWLTYIDGDLDQANAAQAGAEIACVIRQTRPQVVVTFGPDGAYGHPDHIAISQFTLAAVTLAMDAQFHDADDRPPHRVSKLYFIVDTKDLVDRFTRLYGTLSMEIDGVNREHHAWPDWAVSARLDNRAYIDQTIRAINCHESQLVEIGDLSRLSPGDREGIIGFNTYYRAFSLVNGGRRPETDLFAGLR